MRKIQRFCSMLLLLALWGATTLHAQSYDKLWKQVEQAQKKSLPQTVIELTDEIYRKGEREQDAPQMLKAYLCREAVRQKLTPDSLYANLRNLESWAQSETNPVNKAILNALLARQYADFAQDNRRTLLTRTSLDVDKAPEDIREWSAIQFVNKIDEYNRASLQDSGRLLEVSTEKYVPFIVLGDGSRFYHHDMYHLLASRAASTYNDLSGFRADSLISNRINDIYQHMIDTYRHRAGSEDAVVLCSLDYWDWKMAGGMNDGLYPTSRMKGETITQDYFQALNNLIKEFGERQICAEVYFKKASHLRFSNEGGGIAQALKVCDEGLKRYPSYKRIDELKNIREEILQPQLLVTTRESGYPGDSVAMNIQFRNLKGFTLNLYTTTLNEVPWMDHGINKDTYKKYAARKLSSTHYDLQPLPGRGKLPEDVPYLSTDTVFKFMIPRETGVYVLQLIPDVGTTHTEDKFLVSTQFKVLTLKLGDSRTEFTTLDASSGQPIADAKIEFYSTYNNEKDRKLLAEVVTDAGGKAVLPYQNGLHSYVARKGKDTAMLPQSFYMNRENTNSKESTRNQVALLTDRSIYRPGQTVYVKGIAYKQNNDSAHVLEGVDYELVLLDANRQKVASCNVRTNDFGSFTAEFMLPTACLNGMFSVETRDPRFATSFKVEEYKRPAFEITFTPVSEAYRLGEKVMLKGNVKSFNGMMVQDVPLTYTVTRRSPGFNYWNASDKPLLADTLQLNVNGDFTIPLTLDAPAGNSGRYGNMYTYNVEAVVTDEAGETQTASYNLFAGPKAYSFHVSLPTYICKEDSMLFTFGVYNAANIPQDIKGTYRIYSAQDINRFRRNPREPQLLYVVDDVVCDDISHLNPATIKSFKVLKDASATAIYGARGMNGVMLIKTDKNKPIDKSLKQPILEGDFWANRQQDFSTWNKLPSGDYRLELSVRDSLGREENSGESNVNHFLLFSKKDTRPAAFTNLFYYNDNDEFDAGHPAAFLLGTSYRDAYVLMDVFCNQKRIESRVLQLNDTIMRMEYPYKEAYGDGVTVLFTFAKGGEVYSQQIYLKKRQPNRTLDMKWEVFRDRLQPGQKEEWKLLIKTPQGMPAAAEMLATMYDASLDKLYSYNQLLRVFYPSNLYGVFRNVSSYSTSYFSLHFPLKTWKVPVWKFDRFFSPFDEMEEMMQFPSNGVAPLLSAGSTRTNAAKGDFYIRGMSRANKSVEESGQKVEIKFVPPTTDGEVVENTLLESESFSAEAGGQTLQPVADIRTNFAETAFFYPQLRTNEKGEVAFSFIMPQSLTRWNFRGYSHTKNMMTGMLDATAFTTKEFMLIPNMPRFVRIGDKTQIAASIANLTGKTISGTATFTLFDPMTEKVISTQRQKFTVEAGRTMAVNFGFEATDNYNLLGVRLVADGGTFSDGEQHLLPVLSNKAYITETLAMPVRGKQTRTFSLDSLFNRNSRTATDRRLTVEFSANPAWYAVQALPVLSLPVNDNAVSWATAYYANSLAGYIANSQPRIKSVFDSWKQAGVTKETFLSQLQKNQDVKNILLSESPWLLEATTEAEQQARISTLFDVNLLNGRNLSAFIKLKELQDETGAWSWYKGMSGSRYITSYITELLVRLPLLTKDLLPAEVEDMCQKAFGYLNRAALEEYRMIRKAEKTGVKITTISDETMKYLYLIALSGEKVPSENQEAYHYFLSMVGRNLQNGTMVCKAQSFVILKAAGRSAEANEFIASIKEHLVQTDEMGAHFAFYGNPYAWGMMPVSVHVEVMEALRMAGGNDALVEEMKLWLLKQKQTTSWSTPVVTADAIYALLCQGTNLLAGRGDLRIVLGNKVIEPFSQAKNPIQGTGYTKETFAQGSPELKAKSITVEKRDAGIAWGAVYAQYLSPISDVKQQGVELNVEKKLYVERIAADGQKTLQPIAGTGGLSVGDKVVSRLTIRLDRPMDFVQLKDQRGACFEPIGTLSGYRWNNGFGYYVEVEDAATNFFFDHLGKGVYVLEYSYRVARGGTYETGLATIQCAYAPEFASHSTGGTVVVK